MHVQVNEMTKENTNLEERVTRLERANRRLTVVSLLALGSLVVACQGGPGSTRREPAMVESIKTSKLQLVDTAGNLRGTLSADKEGGLLVLNDAKGAARVSLSAGTARWGVELFGDPPAGATGDPPTLAALTADPKRASLDFSDSGNQIRASMGFFEKAGILAFRDETGNVTYSAPDK
jgi:hypothetical protein